MNSPKTGNWRTQEDAGIVGDTVWDGVAGAQTPGRIKL